MQATQSRVEFGLWNASVRWVGHNAVWLGAVVLAFSLGAAWQNGSATTAAVHSVQTAYQGKVQYHVEHEKALEKVAKTAGAEAAACEKNLSAALNSSVAPEDLKGCPPVSPGAPK